MPADTPPAAPVAPPKARLRHRLPKSLRQGWKLAAVFIAFVAVMATVFGAAPIRPLITGDASVIASPIVDNVTGTVDLFDSSAEHRIDIDLNPAEYQDMIQTYQKEGEKDWVSADVTIDGTLLTDVAVRLKGNSTLRSLRGDTPGEQAGQRAPAGLPVTTLSADDPTTLPLLLSFDQYAHGRAYQGMTELSVRPGSPVLNEAVGLSLTAESGQPTQRYGYVVYSVNDSPTQTRLVLEHPDEGYAESVLDGNGVLYKVSATAKFQYQGDDQTTYTEQFKQINGQGSLDLQPVISFLKWLDSADEDTFARELNQWVDTESLARYLATQNLLVNFDDISGPGRNGFLWYDLDTKKISVISWDLNLALHWDSTAGPHDSIDLPMDRSTLPPEQAARIQLGNALKDRYLASPAFTTQYENAYRDLFTDLFASGRAVELVGEIAATIPTSDGLTQEAIDTAAAELTQRLSTRTTALAANPVVART